jgi:flagellar biosynthetic protein FliR
VSIQTGLGFANIVDPQSQVQNAVISQIFTLLGIILFLGINGEATYLRALARSFDIIPIGTINASGAASSFMTMASQIFVIGVQLAAPFIVVLFMLDLSFAIFARIMPQANIFFIALPLKIAGGLIMLLLIVPKLGIAFDQYFQMMFDFLSQILQALR